MRTTQVSRLMQCSRGKHRYDLSKPTDDWLKKRFRVCMDCGRRIRRRDRIDSSRSTLDSQPRL